MKDRTLVYMIFRTDCIALRTVSRLRKSPHRFYILRSRLEELEHTPYMIAHDIESFAVLRRYTYAETIEIELTWLSGDGYAVSGYQETIILPYDQMVAYLNKSTSEDRPVVWKALSIDNSHRQPQIMFKSSKNLHAALVDGTIRHKLVRSLRNEFRWPQSERIEFYDDFLPYSFIFKEIRGGKAVMTGGLILHNQKDISKSHYSIHTMSFT